MLPETGLVWTFLREMGVKYPRCAAPSAHVTIPMTPNFASAVAIPLGGAAQSAVPKILQTPVFVSSAAPGSAA